MLDVAIIGCGVVGAAAAYELSHYPLHTAIFEAENDVADCTTKANSAILHAGYDPSRAPGWHGSMWRALHWPKRSAPGWMCRTGSAAVWCWPSARRSCRICRSCTKRPCQWGAGHPAAVGRGNTGHGARSFAGGGRSAVCTQRGHRQPVGICAGHGGGGGAQRGGTPPQQPGHRHSENRVRLGADHAVRRGGGPLRCQRRRHPGRCRARHGRSAPVHHPAHPRRILPSGQIGRHAGAACHLPVPQRKRQGACWWHLPFTAT